MHNCAYTVCRFSKLKNSHYAAPPPPPSPPRPFKLTFCAQIARRAQSLRAQPFRTITRGSTMPRMCSWLAERHLFLGLLVSSCLALCCFGNFNFRPLVPWGLSPLMRYGHTMVELGANVVLFGGASQNVLLDDVWMFSGMSSTWQQYKLPPSCLSPRYFHAAARVSQDSLVISGGLSNFSLASSSAALADVSLISLASQSSFSCKSLPALPVPLYGHSMSFTSRGTILFGGFSRSDTGSGNVWLLNNATSGGNAQWLLLSASGHPPSPRSFFVSGVFIESMGSANEILVIWGGISTIGEILTPLFTLSHDEQQPVESGWKWDQPLFKGSPPPPRAYAASSSSAKTLFVHGGQSVDGVVLQDLWYLERDIAGFYTWKLQSMPVSAPSVWGACRR